MRLFSLLCISCIAVGAIEPYRIVQAGTDDDAVAPATTSTDKFAGVCGQLGADDAARLDIYVEGIVPVTYGGTVAKGDPLTSDDEGRAIVASPGDTVIGHAAEAGVEDEIGAVHLWASGGAGFRVATGTLAAGTCTIDEDITVTAETKAFPVPNAVITGSTNFACLAHLLASNVAGGPGVGSITIEALTSAGVLDADAAGTFQVILIG